MRQTISSQQTADLLMLMECVQVLVPNKEVSFKEWLIKH